VTENQSAHPSIPLLKSNEEQLVKIRRQLEGMFRELRLRSPAVVLKTLTQIVERFGGKTEMSEARQE
jgi:hypothetical protein